MSLISHNRLNGDGTDLLNRYNGSVNGPTFTDGLIGQAAKFDGVNDTVSFGVGNDLFPLPQFSCAIWFNSFGTTASTGTTPSIFGLTYGVRLRVLANYISFGLDNGTTLIYTNSPSDYDFYNSNIWHHAVVTATATRMSLFVNGVLVSTRSTTWLGQTRWGTNGLRIGRDNNNSNYYFSGLLQDFKIYDHALSEKEVSEVYKTLALSKFPEVNDNTSDSGNFITVPDSPTILGDTSIEMWLYPTTTVRRQTIWNKGYGGEGTVNFEDGAGFLKFYSGYNGDNSGSYENVDSSVIPLNVWTHAVVTRAMPSGDVKWYLNGQLDTTGNFSFSTIGETTFDLTIGSGYTSDFVGNLQGVRQYATVLSATDVESQYKTGLSIDNIGNMHSKHLDESPKVRYIRDYLNGSTSNSGSHWIEIQANDTDGVNVALNADAYDEVGNPEPELTDGNTNTNSYVSGNTYMEVDLGSVFLLDNVHIWHYYGDGRTYYGTKTEVSVDGQNWITIFDNEVDGLYPETPSGKVHRVRSPSKFSVNYSGVSVGEASEVGISRGLVSWLPLIGDTKDRVTNEVATNNGATPVADGYQFDSVDDYIDLPNDLGYDTQVSAFASFIALGTPAGNYHIIFGDSNLELTINTGDFLRSGIETSTGREVSNHGSGLLDGNWHYVGFTFDGSEKIAYIDGVAVGTLATTGVLISSFTNRRIGEFGTDTTYCMNGIIANSKIYKIALTPEEIAQEYNSGKASLNKNSAFAKEFIEV